MFLQEKKKNRREKKQSRNERQEDKIRGDEVETFSTFLFHVLTRGKDKKRQFGLAAFISLRWHFFYVIYHRAIPSLISRVNHDFYQATNKYSSME